MALKAVQITLVTSTATPLLTKALFPNVVGAAADPIPLIVKNEDASIVVWIGGPNVDATHGQSLVAGASIPMALYSNDVPYAFAVGTPIVSVLAGRQ